MYPPPAYIFIYIFVMKPAVSPSSLYIYLLYLLWSRLENLYSTAGIKEQARSYIYIYTLIVWGLFVSFFVCLCLINVKTAEPIGPKFCVGPYLTLGKVYRWSKFQKLAVNKIRVSLNLKIYEFIFYNLRTFLFLFYSVYNVFNEKMFNWNRTEILVF